MRFSLRSLLLFMILAGPLSAYGWADYHSYLERQEKARLAAIRRDPPPRVLKPGAFPAFCGTQPLLETEMGMISLELQEFEKSLAAGE